MVTIKVLNYKFSPKEVYALHRLILYVGWIPHYDEEIVDVVNHICKIVESNGMATRVNQTT